MRKYIINNIITYYLLFIIFLLLLLLFAECTESAAKFNVGVIVDETSASGNVVRSCLTMAISDFYNNNNNYHYEIYFHFRNSKGDPLLALNNAQELVEKTKVEALFVMPKMSSEATLLAMLGDKAKVPIFTLSPPASSSSTDQHPYLIQVSEDEDAGLSGVTTLVQKTGWKNIVLIHDNIDYNAPFSLLNTFRDNQIDVNAVGIDHRDDNDRITENLSNLKRTRASVFVVHVSASLVPRIFETAMGLAMVAKGYAWIVTEKAMDSFQEFDSVVIESMQGVVGFKSHLPESRKLHDFTRRWKKTGPDLELTTLGIRAYDCVWALAKAIESSNKKKTLVMDEISQTKFEGLGGGFELRNRRLISAGTYEVVNVIGTRERRLGFWTVDHGFVVNPPFDKLNGFANKILDSVVWAGQSSTIPRDLVLSDKLIIGVPVKKGFNEFIAVSHDAQTNKTIASGFCVDVFEAAIGSLGYDVSYDLVPFVVMDDDEASQGNYNDLIYQIYLQKFDTVVGDTTLTSNRSLYVDFTLPYTNPGVGTVARLGSTGKWFFLKPFSKDLWIITIISFVITGFTIWLIEHDRNEEFQGSPAQQFGTILWFTSSTLVYAQRERLVSHLSRFVLCIWMLFVFIISASYNASLSSILTLEQIQFAKGDYIGYRSMSQQIIFNNTNFSDNRLIRYTSPEEYHEALSKGEIWGIIDELPYIKNFLAKYPSQYALIKTASTTNGFSFAFQKGSPLVGEVSRAIARLREEGKLIELENKWFNHNKEEPILPQENSDGSNDNNHNFKTLNLANFKWLFLVSGISKAIAIFIFLCCLLHKKLCIYHFIISIIVKGVNLAFMIRYLSPLRKVSTIGSVNVTSPV